MSKLADLPHVLGAGNDDKAIKFKLAGALNKGMTATTEKAQHAKAVMVARTSLCE
jgi:hypothetical protein